MSAMEESLRRALEGGDARDPAFRESIYAASERALERMLETRAADEATANDQRTRLAETINRVEADYAEHVGDEAPAETTAVPFGDELGGPAGPDPLSEPQTSRAAPSGPGEAEWTPGGERPVEAGTRAPAWKVPLLAALMALGLALLAYAITGALRGGTAEETTGSVQSGSDLSSLAWIDIFDGNDLESLSTPSGGRIETVRKPDEREAVRISAPSGSPNEALLRIGPGTLRQIAGRQIRIEVVAGSPDGTMREFGVRCLVGEQSICDLQRFATDMPEEAFVFDVTIPPVATNATSLAIAPGVGEVTNDVDLFSVRLRDLS